MHISAQPDRLFLNLEKRSLILFKLVPLLVLLFAITSQTAQAQAFSVIYSFSGGTDGSGPNAGLTLDQQGNLYGTTLFGGFKGSFQCVSGCGTVFQLSLHGSDWSFTPIYAFKGRPDGANPLSTVTFGSDGSLYGATGYGGAQNCAPDGCGTVYKLTPDSHGNWTESVLYRFIGDGVDPDQSPVTFDNQGDIYLTTRDGGSSDKGAVIELTPGPQGWTATVLFSFTNEQPNGWYPRSGVILDAAGNLYGTAPEATPNVYELTPSSNGWIHSILYQFQDRGDGTLPIGGLIFDPSGNLLGTTAGDGNPFSPGGGGGVFELTPSGGGWAFRALHDFTNSRMPFAGPWAALTRDSRGNLYGTTVWAGKYGQGSIFELTPSGSGWTFTTLHDFTSGEDGGVPFSTVTIDAEGNLYGTASEGGRYGAGVVWEITP
jgi:uncharacterized repeat protein (TIGR03803 family)